MRNLVWAGLATGFLLVGFNVVSANDTVRLGGPSVASGITGGVDTELVRGYGGHGGHYGHGGGHYGHAYHGGHYGHGHAYHGGNYGRGYYGGGYYRPNYGAYYRPYYYGGYYRPYFASYYYQPYYSSYYYDTPYYTSSYYYNPIAGEAIAPPATTLQGAGYYQAPAPRQYVPPMPPPDGGNSTYPYNGGPRSPVPMPNPDTNPAKSPRGVLPADGKLVSLEPTGGVSVPFTHQPSTTTGNSVPRVSYPAYGDEPITPAPRKTSR